MRVTDGYAGHWLTSREGGDTGQPSRNDPLWDRYAPFSPTVEGSSVIGATDMICR